MSIKLDLARFCNLSSRQQSAFTHRLSARCMDGRAAGPSGPMRSGGRTSKGSRELSGETLDGTLAEYASRGKVTHDNLAKLPLLLKRD